MAKKKEDELQKVVAKCDNPNKVITFCDNQQLAVANCDLKNINIESLIRTIRGQKVMFDSDLAMLYGVETRTLNQAVKRNSRRFPDDFMFQVTKEEWNVLRSQIAILEDLKSQNVISKPIERRHEDAGLAGNHIAIVEMRAC